MSLIVIPYYCQTDLKQSVLDILLRSIRICLSNRVVHRYTVLDCTCAKTQSLATMSSETDTFEVERILDDKVSGGKTQYLVRWSNTLTTDFRPFLKRYGKAIRNVTAVDSKLSIAWHDSWVPARELKNGCDEILAAYLLLKLYHHPDA